MFKQVSVTLLFVLCVSSVCSLNSKLLQKSFVQEAKDLAAISLAARKALLQDEFKEINNAQLLINNAQTFIQGMNQKVIAQTGPCKLSVNTRCGASYGSCGVANTYCSYWGWCKTGTFTTNHMAAYNYRAECATPCNVSTNQQCGTSSDGVVHGSCPKVGTYCSVNHWCGLGADYSGNGNDSKNNYKTACAAAPKAAKAATGLTDDQMDTITELAKKLNIKVPKLEEVIKAIANKLHIKVSDRKISSVLADVTKKLKPLLKKIPEKKVIEYANQLASKLHIKIPAKLLESVVKSALDAVPTSVVEGAADIVAKIVPKSVVVDAVGSVLEGILGDAAEAIIIV